MSALAVVAVVAGGLALVALATWILRRRSRVAAPGQ